MFLRGLCTYMYIATHIDNKLVNTCTDMQYITWWLPFDNLYSQLLSSSQNNNITIEKWISTDFCINISFWIIRLSKYIAFIICNYCLQIWTLHCYIIEISKHNKSELNVNKCVGLLCVCVCFCECVCPYYLWVCIRLCMSLCMYVHYCGA